MRKSHSYIIVISSPRDVPSKRVETRDIVYVIMWSFLKAILFLFKAVMFVTGFTVFYIFFTETKNINFYYVSFC